MFYRNSGISFKKVMTLNETIPPNSSNKFEIIDYVAILDKIVLVRPFRGSLARAANASGNVSASE